MSRILVVDDDPAVRGALARALERRGHQVILASSGAEGARLWREAASDLVILDVHMPDMDGIELLAQLRSLHPTVPILIVSGGADTRKLDLLRTSQLLGATAELGKPFTLADLYGAVDRLLTDSRAAG
jgi:CheY-like chemotaxis protein